MRPRHWPRADWWRMDRATRRDKPKYLRERERLTAEFVERCVRESYAALEQRLFYGDKSDPLPFDGLLTRYGRGPGADPLPATPMIDRLTERWSSGPAIDSPEALWRHERERGPASPDLADAIAYGVAALAYRDNLRTGPRVAFIDYGDPASERTVVVEHTREGMEFVCEVEPGEDIEAALQRAARKN